MFIFKIRKKYGGRNLEDCVPNFAHSPSSRKTACTLQKCNKNFCDVQVKRTRAQQIPKQSVWSQESMTG
jgi:hypothetical protein